MTHETRKENVYPPSSVSRVLLWSVRFNTRSRACVCWPPENMLHHKLPAEPNCSHSTRQSIHSRQLKSNFHSIRLAPDCELGERGRRATFSWPKPHATEAERPCAYDAVRARPLCTDRSAALRPQRLSSARARSPELGAAGGHGQQQRFDASLGAGGHCSRGAEAVRHARDGLRLHWQLPERVWSAAIV